ncbi:T9SS type A sorting domain-containing protein [Kaistella flava (ex Peng et al. 2021)]|uniref:T9SS type A sorting domain-containing protein n=1 Tax=Kaistella flava (ex Peng et al. 2021) TaxID=2038776 RepID=A0A7M2YAH2_9FLAO|nr:T9SS type A sorting domain-containing protein [Kaistella flava (ex Peng et al. 2021)]QOW10422.1 T9SS type A sorting domain-containing protein [Kaistella flava (ex Peng et al. 2021)]
MKTKLSILSALLLAASSIQAQVTLPYYESFNYPVGTTLITSGTSSGLGGWTLPFSGLGSSPDPVVIASPTWALPTNLPSAAGNALEFVGSGDDPVLTIPNQGATGKLYSSFVFRVTEQAAVSANSPVYFYSFAKVASNGTSLNYTSCVYFTKLDDNTFNLKVSENNNTNNPSPATGALTLNTDYFIVVAYDIDNAVSSMWVNPVVNGTEPATTFVTNETATSTRTDLTMVRLNLDSNAKTPTIIFDELRVGNSWDSVIANPTMAVNNTTKSTFNLYPNPANEFFTVENDKPLNAVSIYTLDGRLVKTINNPASKKIDISSLSKGVYMVKVKSDNTESTRKLIVN